MLRDDTGFHNKSFCGSTLTELLIVVRSIFRLRNQSHLTNAWVFMLKLTNEMFAGADVARGNFISFKI